MYYYYSRISSLNPSKSSINNNKVNKNNMSTMFIIEENEEDLFDRLPDAIVLTIFDKVEDAKSLYISSSLCKRFRFLTTQTQYISLTIPVHKSSPNDTNKTQLIRFFNTVFLTPFKFVLQQITKWTPLCLHIHYYTKKNNNRYNNCCTCSYTSPNEILKNFTEIKQLEIRLPSPASEKIDINNGGDTLLKWKAEFGSQLKNCLIVGGTSLSSIHNHRIRHEIDERDVDDISQRGDSIELQRMTNDELKLRIVWIISTLIASSSRHCLLEETIKEKRTINNVAITDDVGQGKCCIFGEQVEEMRRNTGTTKMPALKVKMWYVPELELPEEGCVMKGATLVVIKPVEEWSKADDGGDLVAKGFGIGRDGKEVKVFDEVARELVKLERSYSLEMNSF